MHSPAISIAGVDGFTNDTLDGRRDLILRRVRRTHVEDRTTISVTTGRVHENERTHALLCRVMFSAFSTAACTLGGRSSRLPNTFRRTPCLSRISLLPHKHQGKSPNENRRNVPALCYLDEPLLRKRHDRVHLIFGPVKVLDCKRVHGHATDTEA